MEYIGITAAQVDAILEAGGIRPGVVSSSQGTREAIAKVIEENNKQLLEDVKKMISVLGSYS